MAHPTVPASPAALAVEFESLAERDPPESFSQMASALGLTNPSTPALSNRSLRSHGPVDPDGDTAMSDVPNAPARRRAPGRPAKTIAKLKPRQATIPSAKSLSEASKAVESLMRTMPPPLPTDSDILEQKVDNASTVSSRLEEELATEISKREVLEERLRALEMSHNELASKFIVLADILKPRSKGKENPAGGGATSAHTLLAQAGVGNIEKNEPNPLPRVTAASTTTSSRGGLAGGRKRGGL